jgi:transcription termination/antitermination protein NusG
MYERFEKGGLGTFWSGLHVMPQPQWYAVHTRSKCEQSVAGELTAKGVECYLPTMRNIHRWKDRKKEISVPLFSGYVFTRIADDAASRLQVLRTNGAVRILGHGSEIEPVPDFEIESLKRLLESRAACFPHPFLREGSWVRVKYGPLEGVEGLLTRIKNSSRLVLSVQMLAQSVAAEIDAADVEVIKLGAAESQQTKQRE